SPRVMTSGQFVQKFNTAPVGINSSTGITGDSAHKRGLYIQIYKNLGLVTALAVDKPGSSAAPVFACTSRADRWPFTTIHCLGPSPALSWTDMSDVTRILSAIEEGDPHAAEQLLPLVYEELRRLAAHKMAQEKPG